jgi:hypothetical protein
LPLRAHNCDPANESPAFPKEENDAVSAFVRREIAAIKERPDEATVVAEKIAQTHQLLPCRPGGVTLERLYREEFARHWSRPPCDNGQSWTRLKRQPDHAIRYCRGKQLLSGPPKRVKVHGAVQFEQRLFQCRIDYRLALADSNAVSFHVLLSRARARENCCFSARARFLKKTTLVPEAFNNRPDKRQPKLPRDYQATRDCPLYKEKEKQKTERELGK